MIHERIVELITQVHKKVFDKTEPAKIVELFKLGEGDPPQLGITLPEIVQGFFSFLGFPRLMTTAAIRKGINKGVSEGHFGYVTGPKPPLSAAGKFEVAVNKVRFRVPLADDEIDLESGFLMMPQAIPQPPPTVGPGAVVPGGTGQAPLPPGIVPPLPPGSSKPADEKMVALTFTADRNGLFTAWNAIANLADLAGKVQVTIHAESEKGFDKAKLQNGVMEPLREADLIE
jgi:hypothetical protein